MQSEQEKTDDSILKGEVTTPIQPATAKDGKATFIVTMNFVVDSEQLASMSKKVNSDHTYDFKIL